MFLDSSNLEARVLVANTSPQQIALRYEQRIFDRQISNPASFLPFINWADLNLVTAEQAEGAIDSLGLPRSSFADGELKVWITSDRSVSTNLLYVNEDLYPRHIVEGYEYPGHFPNGRILFRCRELDKTPFPQELNHFWIDWVSSSLFICRVHRTLTTITRMMLRLPGTQTRAGTSSLRPSQESRHVN